jgi:hypothetical protein
MADSSLSPVNWNVLTGDKEQEILLEILEKENATITTLLSYGPIIECLREEYHDSITEKFLEDHGDEAFTFPEKILQKYGFQWSAIPCDSPEWSTLLIHVPNEDQWEAFWDLCDYLGAVADDSSEIQETLSAIAFRDTNIESPELAPEEKILQEILLEAQELGWKEFSVTDEPKEEN